MCICIICAHVHSVFVYYVGCLYMHIEARGGCQKSLSLSTLDFESLAKLKACHFASLASELLESASL